MIIWMLLPTRCCYLRRTLYRSMSWPLGQPTSSGCRPSAMTTALEAPAWRNSLRPWLKVCLGGINPRKSIWDVYEWAIWMTALSLLLFRAFSKQHRSHSRCSGWWSSHVTHRGSRPVPTQKVSNHVPLSAAASVCLPVSISVCPFHQSDCTPFQCFLSH